jgi:hypothetical protein
MVSFLRLLLCLALSATALSQVIIPKNILVEKGKRVQVQAGCPKGKDFGNLKVQDTSVAAISPKSEAVGVSEGTTLLLLYCSRTPPLTAGQLPDPTFFAEITVIPPLSAAELQRLVIEAKHKVQFARSDFQKAKAALSDAQRQAQVLNDLDRTYNPSGSVPRSTSGGARFYEALQRQRELQKQEEHYEYLFKRCSGTSECHT